MTSILTNTSAMSALSTLRLIGGRLDDESQKLSSGLGVKTAADNAAYWSISTTMRSDVKAMGAVTDSIGLAMGIVDTAYAAMETVRQSFVEIRNLAITASDMPKPGMRDIVKPAFSLDPEYAKSDVYKIDVRIQQLQDQARSAMQSASFAGVNMLYHEKHEPVKASKQVFSFVIGYNGGTVQTMDVSAMDTLLLNDDRFVAHIQLFMPLRRAQKELGIGGRNDPSRTVDVALGQKNAVVAEVNTEEPCLHQLHGRLLAVAHLRQSRDHRFFHVALVLEVTDVGIRENFVDVENARGEAGMADCLHEPSLRVVSVDRKHRQAHFDRQHVEYVAIHGVR